MSFASRRELRLAYEDCIKKKRGTVNAIDFEVNDNEKLESLYLELNSMTYTIGQSITFVLCDDHNIPRREVFAADFKDRIVHHLLIRRLESYIEKYHYINDSYSCRIGKGTLYGAKRCQEQLAIASENGTLTQVYICKGDLHNCFNSFNKQKIYDNMEQFIIKYFSEDRGLIFNLYLLKLIMFHCPQNEGNYIRLQSVTLHSQLKKEKSLFNCDKLHGIAIGNLTSQVFANFFLTLLDLYVTQVLDYKFYGRFVDDFFYIGFDKKKMLEDYKKICDFILTLDLEVNKNKLYFQHYSKGVPFIGFFIHWNKLNLLNSTRARLYKKLYSIEQYVNKNGIDYREATYIQSTWNSYMGMIIHTKSQCIISDIYLRYSSLIPKLEAVFDFDTNHFIRLKEDYKKKREEQIKSLLSDEFLFE